MDIIQLIKGEKSKYSNIVSDCRALLHQLGNPQIKHTYREMNNVADALAREGENMESTRQPTTLHVLPVFVQHLIEKDRNETSFARIKAQSNMAMQSVKINIISNVETPPTFVIADPSALQIPFIDAY